MGGMGSLYIGVSGLQTSQNALNTTAHNLANVSTKGYVRQQVTQADTIYTLLSYGATSYQQLGLGSKIAQVAQVRDYFLDKAYREEAGRSSFYATAYEAFYEIETIMDDMEGAEFATALHELKGAFNNISQDPTDSSHLAYLKQKSVKFIENAKNCYQALREYQNSLNDSAIDTIDRINELSHTIYDLNIKISSIEAGKVEHANDLRDLRSSALDELSSLIKISYEEHVNGMITVSAEDVPVVEIAFVNDMTYVTDKNTGFITPVWETFKAADAFDLNIPISSDTDTDIGKLKSLLIQRGDYIASYESVPIEADFKDANGNWKTGNWTIDGVSYTDGEKAYNAKLDYFNNRIYPSGIMSTMAQLDYLVHGIATTINDMLCPNVDYTTAVNITDANGNILPPGTYKMLDTDNCSHGLHDEIGVELFSRSHSDRYTEYTDANGTKYYVYNEEDTNKNGYSYCINDLVLNESVKNDPSSLPFYKPNNEVDYENAAALIKAWDTEFSILNPQDTSKHNFMDYYTKLVGQVATKGSVYSSLTTSAEGTVKTLDDNRQMIIGVSSDEELSNMIRYQNAYNAASRYITTVADMLEHLVTSLGS